MAINQYLEEYRFEADSGTTIVSQHDYTASPKKKILKIRKDVRFEENSILVIRIEESDSKTTVESPRDYDASSTKTILKTRKIVRFEENSTTIIASHRDYTISEHRSVWYIEGQYRSFALKNRMEKMAAPLFKRQERQKQSMRNDNIRQRVLQAQSNQSSRKRQRNKIRNENSQRLSDYYKHMSEACLNEAQQRGMENDLELLDIKIQEISDMQKRRWSYQLPSKTSYNEYATKNARWSTRETNIPKDVAPTAIKRGLSLRPILCKDLYADKNLVR